MSLNPGKFVDGLHDYIGRALRPLHERIKALEAEVESVKRKGVEYRGVWQAAQEYQRGSLVTHQGSLWHANTETRDCPGDGKSWTLAVKHGSMK